MLSFFFQRTTVDKIVLAQNGKFKPTQITLLKIDFMIPLVIQHKFEETLSTIYKHNVKIKNIIELFGGSINQAFKITTTNGCYFLKFNLADKYPKMFESEAKGLQLLKQANVLYIPEIIVVEQVEDYSFLVLEFVESGKTSLKFWQNFGISLARMHKHTHETFGLDNSNYIGSLFQSNTQYTTWTDFFIAERLEKQLKLAVDAKLADESLVKSFEQLFKALPSIFTNEAPALIHGDLWSGNFMIAPNGEVCLIDPAVYFGNREMDIAMSKLFGEFDHAFYNAYNQEFPLTAGWQERIDIHSLYPLLVHLNLFGRIYLKSIRYIMKKFSS